MLEKVIADDKKENAKYDFKKDMQNTYDELCHELVKVSETDYKLYQTIHKILDKLMIEVHDKIDMKE